MPLLPPPLPLDTEGSRMIVVLASVFPAIATLSLFGRFISRSIKDVRLGLNDYVLIPGLFAVYGQCIIVILSAVYGGIGHHSSSLSAENQVVLYKLLAGVQFTFGTSLGLAKVSLCLLLIQIFPSPRFRQAAYIVLAYCVCWILMVYSIGAGLCRPFAFNWDKTIPDGRCGNLNGAYISIAVFDILGDLMIIALPMQQIWRLHARTTVKVGLSVLFALGLLNVIVAILRIVYLLKINFTPGSDVPWQATDAYAWSVVEPSLGFIVANGAVLAPAISRGVRLVADSWRTLSSTSLLQKVRPGFPRNSTSSRSRHVQVDSTDDSSGRRTTSNPVQAERNSIDQIILPPFGVNNFSHSCHVEANSRAESNVPPFSIQREVVTEVGSRPK